MFTDVSLQMQGVPTLQLKVYDVYDLKKRDVQQGTLIPSSAR